MNIAADVAWPGQGGGGESFAVFLAVAACLVVWAVVRERARTRRIRQLARSRNLASIGARMPVACPLQRARAFAAVKSLRRAVVGSNGPRELVLVDCRIGHRRRPRGRTIVAVRGEPDGYIWMRLGPDLSREQVDEWSLVYSSNRYMTIEEIEGLMAVFSGPEPLAQP